ncbi:MAG TPA: MarR family transcriptional regulator [Acetobacteraceae bacterium]|nr:MarR family transcriptional regulator [Acetobacteraceae bacterium]
MKPNRRRIQDGFGSLIARAARQWRRAVDRRLQPFGLTEATWLPLIYLARAPDPMRQKDLAAALTLDGSSVVRLLDALEAAGFIERHGEDRDRRAKIIVPTPRGLAIAEQIEAVSREVRTATLTGLSGEELEIATRVLERVCRNLGAQQDAAQQDASQKDASQKDAAQQDRGG